VAVKVKRAQTVRYVLVIGLMLFLGAHVFVTLRGPDRRRWPAGVAFPGTAG